MVSYNAEKRIITLSNGNISYVIYINPNGVLEQLYFGKYWEGQEADLAALPVRDGGEILDMQTGEMTHRHETRTLCYEISSHGLWDKRGAPIVIPKENGSTVTDFRYLSHKAYKGIHPLATLPSAKGGEEDCDTVEFLLKETSRELYLTYCLTLYRDSNILVRHFALENKTSAPVFLDRAMSMQLDLPSSHYDIVHFPGRWAQERDYEENPVLDGVQEISSNYGRSGHEENPFVYLKEHKATNDRGEVIGFNLIYSSNFKFRTFVNRDRQLHITYGINDEDFCWKLEAGETFETPQAVIAYSAEGIDGMSQAFHHFIREHLITYRHDKEYKPVLFNSWEGCYFNFNTESVISYIDDAIKIGTELFVLDDGWFGARNNDRLGLGDWYVNRQKVDLHKIMAHCKEKGIKFGIWFEPEMVNPVSDLYAAHPDYVPGEPDAAELSLHRHQLHLDFSVKEVVDNIYAQMKAFLQEYPVSYIKWDYNRVVNEHFSRHYPADRQGEIYHRMMLGYYDLIGRLTREYPDIMFEGCSSGGGRFDLGTLYFCPQIWTSDESDPSQRIAIQYNTSLGYPLSTIGAHVNDSKVSSYKTKAILALFGTYGYEMNPNILTASEQEELREIAEIYCKYHQSVIGNGTLYHLLSPNEGNLMCMQSVSKDQTASLVILMNYRKEHAQFRVIRLRGLDPEKQYKNSYTGTVHSGTFYMERGIDFSSDGFASINCRLVILTEEA